MKALLVIATAALASAGTSNCQIPSEYTITSGTGCGGAAEGYKVYGFCSSGLANSYTTTNQIFTELTSSNLNAFTSSSGGASGCVVPSSAQDWSSATTPTTAGSLTTNTDACNAAGNVLTTSSSPIKGVAIYCDRENGYFPVQGVEGPNICNPGTVTAAQGAVIATANGLDTFGPQTFVTTSNTEDALVPEFTGTNALRCAQGCDLPATIYRNGAWHSNIAGAGEGIDLAAGTIEPNSEFSFYCQTGFRQFSPKFTFSCEVAAGENTATTSTNYAGECGSTDGAATARLFDTDDTDLDELIAGLTSAADALEGYAFTSTLRPAYPVSLAHATGAHRDFPIFPLIPGKAGYVFNIDASGCNTLADDARIVCVQNILNYWRCEHDVEFNGGELCWVNTNIDIACPTNELGFDCPSSSKKGLLGLLGLLGLIPLLLCLCCLLWLCCIRRKKTESDVHFATFDPHAAPIVATAPVATAVPTAFCATPYAASACPML